MPEGVETSKAQSSAAKLLQPHPLTSAMQMAITFCSLCVAAAAIIFAINSMSEERNARLVEIGVGILRVDPKKEAQVSAARRWALDLIDANAGGVKFSAEARTELLNRQLGYDLGTYGSGRDDDSHYGSGTVDRPLRPAKPK